MTQKPTCEQLEQRVEELEQEVAELRRAERSPADSEENLRIIDKELAAALSDVLEALKRISLGDPFVRISETSKFKLITELKQMVNLTAQDLSEIVSLSHEFAIGLAEHFDVLHRVSEGDLNARVSGSSPVELLESLRKLTNQMIENVSAQIIKRKLAEEALKKVLGKLEKRVEERTAELVKANEQLKAEIVERKLAEKALQQSEDLLKKSQEIAHVGSWSLDLKKNELYWTDEVYRIFGLKPQKFDATYEAFLESVHFQDRDMVEKAYNEAVRKHRPYEITHRVLRPDGEVRVVHEKSVDILDEFGKTIRSIGMVHDITERQKAEEGLRASEERYRSYIEVTEQLGWTTNADGEVVEDIPTWRRYTGQSKEEVKGWGWSMALHPDDVEPTTQIWRKAVSTRSKYETEYRILRYDGIYRHFLARGVPVLKEDGSVREWVGTCIDITEWRQAEQQIKKSLREKELLLMEIHHRVKNNLQTIVSLLNMSSMQTQNEEAKELLREARAKVFTMALIHTQLYQGKQFNQIDMGKHVRQLITHLGQAYINKKKTIRTVIEPSDVRLSINQAIPCGLVLNELVSNAFKHAFQDKHGGKIRVSLRYIDSDMVGIKVKDDGIGIPEDVDTDKPKTLGLELVNALVKQLMGTVQFSQDNGTEVNIQFRALKEEEADA